MSFKLRTVITVTEQEIDLRSLPVKDWPEEAKALITYEMLKEAKKSLLPKNYLVSCVERKQANQQEFDRLIKLRGF